MIVYRLHIIDHAGQTARVIDLSFSSDERAMAEVRARQYVEATELWRGDLKVAAFPADHRPELLFRASIGRL